MQQLGSARVQQHPLRTSVEETPLVGKRLHQGRLHAAAERNRAPRQGMLKKMTQDGALQAAPRLQIYDFAQSVGIQMIHVASGDLLLIRPYQDLLQSAEAPHSRGPFQYPLQR